MGAIGRRVEKCDVPLLNTVQYRLEMEVNFQYWSVLISIDLCGESVAENEIRGSPGLVSISAGLYSSVLASLTVPASALIDIHDLVFS